MHQTVCTFTWGSSKSMSSFVGNVQQAQASVILLHEVHSYSDVLLYTQFAEVENLDYNISYNYKTSSLERGI